MAAQNGKLPSTSEAKMNLADSLRALWQSVLGIDSSDIKDDSHFFDLGADSVAVIRLLSRASSSGLKIDPKTLYSHPIFRDMVRTCEQAEQSRPNSQGEDHTLDPLPTPTGLLATAAAACDIQEQDVEDVLPCTPQQVFFMGSRAEDIGYVARSVFKIKRQWTESFRRAWTALCQRHSMLRTRIFEYQGELYQAVVRGTIKWAKREDHEGALSSHMALGKPMSQQAIWYDEQGDAYFSWIIAHPASDGWSKTIMYSDMMQCLANEQKYLAQPAPPQYADFVRFREASGSQRSQGFWSTLLMGCDANATLPADVEAPPLASAQEVRGVDFSVSLASMPNISALLHVAWGLAHAHLTRADDVVFISNNTGRAIGLEGADAIIGPMVAVVPFRVKIRRESALTALITAVQEQIVDGWAHGPWGLPAITEHFGARHRLLPNIMFDLNFPFDPLIDPETASLVVEPQMYEHGAMELALFLHVAIAGPQSLRVQAGFDDAFCPRDRVKRVLDCFADVLVAVMAATAENVSCAEVLDKIARTHSPLDGNEILSSIAKKPADSMSPADGERATLEGLYDNKTAAPALIIPDGSSCTTVTYLQLSNLVEDAKLKLQRLGVRTGHVVSLCMTNGLEMVVFFLAIAKLQAIAAPLNPALTPNELRYHLSDAQSVMVLVNGSGQQSSLAAVQDKLCQVAKELDLAIAHCSVRKDNTVACSLHQGIVYTAKYDGKNRNADEIALILYTSELLPISKDSPRRYTDRPFP